MDNLPIPAADVEPFDSDAFLARAGPGRTLEEYAAGQSIFVQGDIVDALFHINYGKVALSVVSKNGKEGIVGILGAGEFFGEGCIVGQTERSTTAKAMTSASVMRLQKVTAMYALSQQPVFTQLFLQRILVRRLRIEDDLVDQLFHSSEKRLARVLLLLANFDKDDGPQVSIGRISQETLAGMVGTTRSRVSLFMNKFRKLGFIAYDGHVEVHRSLSRVLIPD